MRTRIITAIVAIAVFIAVVYFLPPVCFTVAVSVICAVAAFELTWRSKIVKVPALAVIACVFSATAPFLVALSGFEKYALVYLFAVLVSVFAVWLLNYGKASLVMTMASFFAGAILPLMFSVIVRIRALDNGGVLILLPFLAAWMTDTGAYFTGVFLGKHKLCEKISPKKTVEGAIGGIVTCVVSLVAFAYFFKLQVNYVSFGVGALVLSLLAQAGDLSFSIIKREYNIKDYGNIMPGHGGVLDRFDSTMFTVPATYVLLMIIGIIV